MIRLLRKLVALAVTSATRSEALPDIPTVGEFVPGYEAIGWFGIGAPKNTPPKLLTSSIGRSTAVMADPKTKARFVDLGVEPMSMTPADFDKFIVQDTEKWGKVIRAANIKLD